MCKTKLTDFGAVLLSLLGMLIIFVMIEGVDLGISSYMIWIRLIIMTGVSVVLVIFIFLVVSSNMENLRLLPKHVSPVPRSSDATETCSTAQTRQLVEIIIQSQATKTDSDNPPSYEDIIAEDRNRHGSLPDRSNGLSHYIDLDLGLPTYADAAMFAMASKATTR